VRFLLVNTARPRLRPWLALVLGSAGRAAQRLHEGATPKPAPVRQTHENPHFVRVLEALSAFGETEPATRGFTPGFNSDQLLVSRGQKRSNASSHMTREAAGKDSHAAGRGANDAIWATLPCRCESAV
jgi:hypothetical protein